MKLLDDLAVDISIIDMKCGQIGIITQWSGMKEPIGKIVQRYEDIIVILGEHAGSSYDSVIKNTEYAHNLRVMILPPGTKLEI